MKEYSESEIIDCLRKRDSSVVKYLSEKYMSVVRLLVFQNGGSSDDARDIFQDALIIILEKIDEGDFVFKCKFSTYLYSVCENLWRSVIDRRVATANYVSSVVNPEPERDISDIMDRELHEFILRDALEKMDQTSRDILNLYWQDVPNQEIADRLGISYGYVRKRKCEAQNELIMRIKQHPQYLRIMLSEKVAREIVK